MSWGIPFTKIADLERERRQQEIQRGIDNYQSTIRHENARNLQLQNEALYASIQAMRRATMTEPAGTQVGIDATGTRPAVMQTAPQLASSASGSANQNFPSLAEIRSMIESSQRKAEEDFQGKIDLLQTQERQKEEEDRLSASNAAAKRLNYERIQSGGAWESALRGR